MPKSLLLQLLEEALENVGLTRGPDGEYGYYAPEVIITPTPEEKLKNALREKTKVNEGVVNPMFLPGIGKGIQYIPKALLWASKTKYVAPVINWGRRVVTSKPARVVGEVIDTAISPRNWIRYPAEALGWIGKKIGFNGLEKTGKTIVKAEPAITSGYWGYGLVDDITHPEETSWYEYPVDALFTLGSANRLRKALKFKNYLEFPLVGTGVAIGLQHLLPVEFILDHSESEDSIDDIMQELEEEYNLQK